MKQITTKSVAINAPATKKKKYSSPGAIKWTNATVTDARKEYKPPKANIFKSKTFGKTKESIISKGDTLGSRLGLIPRVISLAVAAMMILTFARVINGKEPISVQTVMEETSRYDFQSFALNTVTDWFSNVSIPEAEINSFNPFSVIYGTLWNLLIYPVNILIIILSLVIRAIVGIVQIGRFVIVLLTA